MSADTQIPEDIMQTARLAYHSAFVGTDSASQTDIYEAIAKAILAERERCAKVADAAVKGRAHQQIDAVDNGDRRAARDFETMKFEAVQIAAAIRKGGA